MTAKTARTPWHLWAVGLLSLLWNAYGASDYFMTKTKGADYMRSMGMGNADVAYMEAMPAFMTAIWAIGVWGAVLGSLLLLLRNKLAVPVFIASFVSFVASLFYFYLIAPMPGASGFIAIMQAIIFAACVFFIWYSMRMSKAGVLR